MSSEPLNVAVPWSLSHYIPLNGFHPLYRALFDSAPWRIRLHAWDNVKLYRRFSASDDLKTKLLEWAYRELEELRSLTQSGAQKYGGYFRPCDHALTALLPGALEFHHTALFPSLTRPFVVHCEMFASVLFPYAHQGSGGPELLEEVKEHYRKLLAHPLCLGIWSDVPETLESFRMFFSDEAINRKLFLSRMGLSKESLALSRSVKKPPLSFPRFLFINSAHQQPGNFVKRGGHVVLRFWKKFLETHRGGMVILRCRKPEKKTLADHGVDVAFVEEESGKSIVWVEDYLSQHEMNALFAHAHFLLLPSFSLHSASILHALAFGTIPLVTDTIGTNVYVRDDITGVVLGGMKDALWRRDPKTGIFVDSYGRIPELEESLVSQMGDRIGALLDDGCRYERISANAVASAEREFNGQAFADSFWREVVMVYERHHGTGKKRESTDGGKTLPLDTCLLDRKPIEWSRLFESPPQPMPIMQAGRSAIWEIGGVLVQSLGLPMNSVHDFCAVNEHGKSVTFAYRLEELDARYLAEVMGQNGNKVSQYFKEDTNRIVRAVATVLRPFPPLYRLASWSLNGIRRALILARRNHQETEAKQMKIEKIEMVQDIQLVKEGVNGYNVIRCGYQYFAILQSEGAFSLAKAESGGYSKCFVADSLEKILELLTMDHAGNIPRSDQL